MPYLAEPDDKGWGKEHEYLINAAHARGLPGVICPVEGRWATTGLQYPTLDIELMDSRIGRLPDDPISVDDYRALVAEIEPITGPERPLGPGAQFGPLIGTARGSLSDFAWLNPWTMLVRRSTYQELLSSGFSLNGGVAKISAEFAPDCGFDDGSTESLVELEARCKVALANLPSRDVCPACGRRPITRPKRMVLEAASYDGILPLQRIVEMPAYFVVNDALAAFIRGRGFSNIVLTEIELK